jgi:nucleoside-diphosphate-sugar epimerase
MILIAGGSGLIGDAISLSILTNRGHAIYNYDLKETTVGGWMDAKIPLSHHLLEDKFTIKAFIDCARYSDQKDQIKTWNTMIDYFRQRGSGKMILFSSIYGHKAPDFSIYPGTEIAETPLEYAMSKAATEQATRFLAQKLKPYNIQVNCIAPGGVLNGHSQQFQNQYAAGKAPMIEPKNILPAIDMLLHPDNVMTGQILTIDAGWSL